MRRVPDAVRANMLRLYAMGWDVKDIARIYGVHHNYIYNLAGKYGVRRPRGSRKKYSRQQARDMALLHDAGRMDVPTLCSTYGLSTAVVYRAIAEGRAS